MVVLKKSERPTVLTCRSVPPSFMSSKMRDRAHLCNDEKALDKHIDEVQREESMGGQYRVEPREIIVRLREMQRTYPTASAVGPVEVAASSGGSLTFV